MIVSNLYFVNDILENLHLYDLLAKVTPVRYEQYQQGLINETLHNLQLPTVLGVLRQEGEGV